MMKFLKSILKQYAIAVCFLTLGTVIGATLSFQVTKEIVIMVSERCVDEILWIYSYVKPSISKKYNKRKNERTF